MPSQFSNGYVGTKGPETQLRENAAVLPASAPARTQVRPVDGPALIDVTRCFAADHTTRPDDRQRRTASNTWYRINECRRPRIRLPSNSVSARKLCALVQARLWPWPAAGAVELTADSERRAAAHWLVRLSTRTPGVLRKNVTVWIPWPADLLVRDYAMDGSAAGYNRDTHNRNATGTPTIELGTNCQFRVEMRPAIVGVPITAGQRARALVHRNGYFLADDDELLGLMRDSGCAQVLIGLESASERPRRTGIENELKGKAGAPLPGGDSQNPGSRHYRERLLHPRPRRLRCRQL